MGMNILKNTVVLIVLIFISNTLILAAWGNGRTPAPGSLDTDRVLWKSLCFKAEIFFVALKTDVRFEILTAEKIREKLIPVPGAKALQASGPEIFSITARSAIRPFPGSTETIRSKAWCDPQNNAALQLVRVRHGKKDWRKTYRFTDKGVLRLKKNTSSGKQPDLSAISRNDAKNSLYTYDLKKTGCPGVLEPSELFAIVSMPCFSAGHESTLCVFSKKGLYYVDIRVKESRLKVDYIERSGKSKVQRKGYIDCIRILFSPRPAAGKNPGNRNFSFLGLNGNFEIFTDKISKIPVLVSGNVPGFGKTDFRLHEAELR